MASPTNRPGSSRRIPVAIFVAITLALLAAGYWYYRKETEAISHEKYEAIAAIGELKSRQIQEWRKERLASVGVFARGSEMSRGVAAFLRNPSSPGYRSELLGQLQLDRMVDQYRNVLLFALDGQKLLSAEAAPAPVDPATLRLVVAAQKSNESVLSDFFREADGIVCIDAAAVVRDAERQPLAVLILRSRADAYLFPLIQSWPTPSPSAETLLVQPEGQEVIYLNALRHRSQAAMTLRVPQNKPGLLAAQALLGKQGEFRGKDYRNVDVVADLRQVPNSPWFMVAKVDADEILAEARYRAGMISLVVGSFILLAAFVAAYAHRHQQAGLFRELYESGRKEHEAQKTFRATLLGIGEGVITTDRRGFVLVMNPVAEKLTGWLEADAHGKPLEQVFHVINEDTRAAVENPVDQVLWMEQTVALADPTLLIARDGIERSITFSAAPIRDDSDTISDVVLVFSDRTSERAAQKELRQNEQRLRTIIEAEPECVKLVDPNGLLMEMNPAGLAILEAGSLQEVQGCGLIDFIRPEFQDAFKALHARVMGGESGTLEFEITGLKGTRRLLETHAVPLRDANGQVSMLLGITRDITEHKAAEAGMLQRSRQLAVLSRASRQINTVLESPLVMRQLVTTAMELTGATDGSAGRLLDGKLVFKEYNLQGKPMPINFEFEAGYGVPGWVMQNRAPYMSNDAENDPHVIPDIQKALGFHNLADVPIINHQGELLGCFEIHNKPGGFNETDLLMLQGLAASAATALENAELLSELKRAEEAQAASAQFLRETQAIAGLGSYTLYFNAGRWTSSGILDEIFGIDALSDRTVEGWVSLIHPADQAMMADYLTNEVMGKGNPFDKEYRIIRKRDGLERWVHGLGRLEFDAQNRPIKMVGTIQDITERRRAEEALRESQELFSLYLSHSPIYTYIKEVTPTESRVLHASENFQEMIGISGHEMVGKTTAELFPPGFAEQITADDWAVVAGGAVLRLDEELNGRNYTSIKFPVVQGGRTLLAGYTIDITERKQAEEVLKKQTDDLRASNDTLTRFNRVAVDRELRMVELKREVNELCGKLGEPIRHRLAEEDATLPPTAKAPE